MLFIAGPNGSGKTSLFALLDEQGREREFQFINADLIARIAAGVPAADYLAQKIADLIREHMLGQRSNFATETVFSDEKGAKLDYLRRAEEAGFRVVLIYVTLANWQLSKMRVHFRVHEHGGHDVPAEKLQRRFIASRMNCRRALAQVETSIIIDNSLAEKPLRPMAVLSRGKMLYRAKRLPPYVEDLLPDEADQLPGLSEAANDT